MYLRFVSPVPASRGRGQYGLFSIAGWIIHDPETPEHARGPIQEMLDWFNTNLPAPHYRHFAVKSRKRWYDEGICWFRADAQDMVANANLLAALLNQEGAFLVRLNTRRPGQILYSDSWQVVAKPSADTPVRWH